MRISDWSSDVCSSDLLRRPGLRPDLRKDYVAVLDRDCDRAQRFAAAGAGDADAAGQFERRAVHGADQIAFAALEALSRRPVPATAGVRADVEPGVDGVAVAWPEQRPGFAVAASFAFCESPAL